MGSHCLGISIGSAFCRSAWVGDSDGRFDAPVAFYRGPDGVLVGHEAASRERDPVSRPYVRHRIVDDLGRGAAYHFAEGSHTPVEVAGMILGAHVRECEKRGGRVARAAIAHPVGLDPVGREALRSAAAQAGLEDALLLDQAQATALDFEGAGHRLDERVLVVDVGSARTDLTVLAREPDGSFGVASTPISLPLAGDAFDRRLYAHVARLAGRSLDDGTDQAALAECRRVKERLSEADAAAFHDGDRPNLTISRNEFEALVREDVEEIVRAAREVGVSMVLLTGGGSRVPLLRKTMAERHGAGAVLLDPDGAGAARGALAAAGEGQDAKGDTRMDDQTQKKGGFGFDQNLISTILEEARRDPLLFLIVGRTGVGKSSTINSLVERAVAPVGAYEPTTFGVASYPYESDGAKFTFIDTPGLCDDLEEAGNDETYLRRMQENVKEFHSLWFVTDLPGTRVSRDELRAIKLLTEAFEDAEKVWERAVIVFTRANSPCDDPFPVAFERRTQVMRKAIAKFAGEEIASTIPSVAIENHSDTTPDGKLWRGEFYLQVLRCMNDKGKLIFVTGTSHIVDKAEKANAAGSSGASPFSGYADDSQIGQIWRETEATIVREVRRREETWASAGEQIGSVIGLGGAGKAFGGWLGRLVDTLKG